MEIVIREVDRSEFPIEGGRVVIEHLHQHAGLQGGVSPTRGYPQKLTEFIRLGLQHGSIISVSGSASGGNLLSMVSYKRLDYTFEFPLVTQAMSQTMRMPNALLSLPVAELRELVPTGIYCPRTPWGKAMALRIDRAIKQLVGQPATLLELYSSAARLEYAAELKAYFYSRSQWQLDD
jgi:uncharacterized protein (TIGR02285 family)